MTITCRAKTGISGVASGVAKLFPFGGGAQIATDSALSLTADANLFGVYSFAGPTQSSVALTGIFDIEMWATGATVPFWYGIISLGSASGTYTAAESVSQIDLNQSLPGVPALQQDSSLVASTVGALLYAAGWNFKKSSYIRSVGTSTIGLGSSGSTVANSYVGSRAFLIYNGSPANNRFIVAYDNVNKIITVDRPWDAATMPSINDQFVIMERNQVDAMLWNGNVVRIDGSSLPVVSFSTMPSLTVPAAVAVASQTPGLIQCVRGDTLNDALPLMGTISARVKLVWTAKLATSLLNGLNTDSQAVIQVTEGIGLTVLNGASAGLTAANGSLTVTDATTGAVTLVIKPAVTSVIPLEDLVWDCQWIDGSGNVATPISGTMGVTADVTQAIR